ncbi:class IV adenylate cyclase [Maridesulfovibrio salexigens]|uniref:Adenylate cyclase n=1 Tax=Maridesulfovibrio salexigens (strain ATCC 14822 / DSM 2638 / NCIMB 8403 / VKM B-1763) TaxID=526222 RepID=C6C2A1_MARSD|nr:class IV adenylate cyclase [Maridesulfovibrio salexigens]ACS81302.1 adenylate cyclase [Maridesulfovibrio salexigens DSM 2638]
MSNNIEIKAHVSDPENLERRVKKLCGPRDSLLLQKDIFYKLNKYRVKLRNVNGVSELIIYKRKNSTGPKQSSYLRIPIPFPKFTHKVLKTIFGTRGIVEKKRTLFFYGKTRIHLDEVQKLGSFLEFEVVLGDKDSPSEGIEIANELMQRLEIERKDLIAESYIDLIEKLH